MALVVELPCAHLPKCQSIEILLAQAPLPQLPKCRITEDYNCRLHLPSFFGLLQLLEQLFRFEFYNSVCDDVASCKGKNKSLHKRNLLISRIVLKGEK